MVNAILLVIITIFIPPLGVFLVAGCGADLLINILLTFLGYFPGHIHAFYLEYVYFKRRDEARAGILNSRPAGGIYSQRVQNGGHKVPYNNGAAGAVPGAPVQQPMPVQQQQGYGTVQ